MDKVIAMYDVRGIQKYIYRTQKVKDAMGASALVENIIERALEQAVKGYDAEIKWYDDETGVLTFAEKDIAVQVLFIGGGNAYVLFQNEDICRRINQCMSKYVLEETYSLQLAAAYVSKSDNYSEDYKRLHKKMNDVKAKIKSAKPIGALPIMQTELKTGYPLTKKQSGSLVSTETDKKDEFKRKEITDDEEKILDDLIYKKGVDSNLAVVHIDGNNMGLRIRKLLNGETDYTKAVNKMRKISYNIKTSYSTTFKAMQKEFEPQQDEKKKLVRKIVVAGDDITYVCNARIALDTVVFFVKTITGYTMNGETTDEARKQYGFSVCAGIAYMKSHFPFAIAYDVAEACCGSAKDRAKSEENKEKIKVGNEEIERIGNYMDFQICDSVQCRNLTEMRRRDYETPTGEQLLIRPYYIPTDFDGGLAKHRNTMYHYKNFKNNILYFLDENHIPRSYAEKIRNTYPLGSHEIEMLARFLESRKWEMPDKKYEMFRDKTALWYDALEMMDYCIDWKEAKEKEEGDS